MVEDAKIEATDVMRRVRGLKFAEDNNFDFMTSDALLAAVNQITGVAFIVMIAISAIALVVAGIGIMNVMYVTVSERTKEIGIRKSICARRGDILSQFAVEAMIISFVGGVIGVLLVQVMIWGVSFIPMETELELQFPPGYALLGLIFSIVVGLIFGIAPARRAAHMNVVEALRNI
jgi:putative ABC transport system permease protein